jgi:hypothetical protein
MSTSSERYIATLILPDEYMRHLNQVASMTRESITVVKRKFVSKAGWELVQYPTNQCDRIIHKDERPLTIMIAGGLLVGLIVFICYMVGIYWNDLSDETKVPVGMLALAGIYGLKWLFESRRHRLIFVMRDGGKLIFKSRSGDYKAASYPVQKIVEFARGNGLLQS